MFLLKPLKCWSFLWFYLFINELQNPQNNRNQKILNTTALTSPVVAAQEVPKPIKNISKLKYGAKGLNYAQFDQEKVCFFWLGEQSKFVTAAGSQKSVSPDIGMLYIIL